MTDLDRRAFLRRGVQGVGGVALLGSPLLAACSSSKSSIAATATTAAATATTAASPATTAAAPAKLGALAIQLSWIKNVEFSGEYLADTNGYYTAAGFDSTTLMSGGPTVQQEAVVAAGKAFLGVSAPDITAAAVLQGGPLVIIGAQYQKNPFAVMSLAKTPLKTPQDMIGKKIGVQAVNEPVWNAFLASNKIDGSKIKKIPVQFDPQPLVNGEVDGWFSFVTNEPNLLKAKGVDTAVFLLNDFGYPLVSETYFVQKSALTKDRDKVKALMVAEIKGWHDSLSDPSAGPKLVVSKYGKDLGLDVTEQTLESKAQNLLILTDDTKANGLFTVTDKLIADTISTLNLAGVKITAAQLFDLSLIKEVYSEHPELKQSPA